MRSSFDAHTHTETYSDAFTHLHVFGLRLSIFYLTVLHRAQYTEHTFITSHAFLYIGHCFWHFVVSCCCYFFNACLFTNFYFRSAYFILFLIFCFSRSFRFAIWWAHKPNHDMCKLCVVVFPLRASYYSSTMNTIVESEPPMVKLLNKLFYFTVGDFVACDFSLNCSQVIWYSL